MADIEVKEFRELCLQRVNTQIGSPEFTNLTIWVLKDKIFRKSEIRSSIALCKVFDEIIVNAIDQYNRKNTNVKNIWIRYDNKTGEVVVRNDGRGIQAIKKTWPKYGEKYNIEAIISIPNSGTNFGDEKEPDRITGGINGIGMKVVNVTSDRFRIETAYNGELYRQQCSDNMGIIEPPLINKTKESDYTEICFTPSVKVLCKGATSEVWTELEKYIIMRTYQSAMSTALINYRYDGSDRIEYRTKPKIWYNGTQINIRTLTDIAKLFDIERYTEIAIESVNDKIRFPWYMIIGKLNAGGKSQNMDILNGVYLEDGGSHQNQIYAHIADISDRMVNKTKKEDRTEFSHDMFQNRAGMFVLNILQMPIPDFSGGNTKTSIKIPVKKLNELKKTYFEHDDSVFHTSKIEEKIWKIIETTVRDWMRTKEFKDQKNTINGIKVRKHEKAERIGDEDAILIVPEGSSAYQTIAGMLTSKVKGKDPKLSKVYCGTYNIQGVPPNVCKQTEELIDETGKRVVYQYPSLVKNIALQGLYKALGLDYDEDYFWVEPEKIKNDKDRERLKRGNVAFSKLNYKRMIVATDQDLDGIGNICSLLLVYIVRFFPYLIKRGFVYRLQTPIIRVYGGPIIEEFYSDKLFKEWCIAKFKSEEVQKPYKVHYYKGLATHSEKEVDNMALTFKRNMIKITWEQKTIETMNEFYGHDTEERKINLLSDSKLEYSDDFYKKNEISARNHFRIESLLFQLEFMERKLKNAIDGFIPTQRKIFDAARTYYSNKSKTKVFQFTGYVADVEKYANGDKSLNDTAIKMGQTFPGSNIIPPLLPHSFAFGDRNLGRSDTGGARYLNIGYNKVMDYIYPKDDDWLLDYVTEDGAKCEPVYYVPVVPMSILENTKTVSVGWKILVWAREWDAVIAQLKNMINYDYPSNELISKPSNLFGKFWKIGKMRCVTYLDKEYCLGNFEVKGDRVIIDELPIKMWAKEFCNHLEGLDKDGNDTDKSGNRYPVKDLVKKVFNKTGKDTVEIVVEFHKGAIEKLNKDEKYNHAVLSPIEQYLEMYQIMEKQINMFTDSRKIREFKNYEDVICYWYPFRKHLYEKRLVRMIILLELKKIYYENVIRYIEMNNEEKIKIDRKKEDAENIKTLIENKFQRINDTLLFKPEYTQVDKLRDMILTKDDSGYDYILNITERMKSKTEFMKIKHKLEEVIDELEELRKTTWKTVWLKEIDVIDKKVKEGINKGWAVKGEEGIFTT